MKYMGGKARIAKNIVEVLEYLREPGQVFIEPFCGACNITAAMVGDRVALDACDGLIAMWSALQNGWIPPNQVSREEWERAKISTAMSKELKAYIGFACSYGGDYFRGYSGVYTTGHKHNYPQESYNSTMRKVSKLKGVAFHSCDYREIEPVGDLIYCDPPYEGTTAYAALNAPFDHKSFWEVMRRWSKCNTVLISEYSAPLDFEEIWSKSVPITIAGGNAAKPRKIERLFVWKG